ncbi:MAG: hypothetical protein AAFX90_10060 [Pseudomonadota bacterium]
MTKSGIQTQALRVGEWVDYTRKIIQAVVLIGGLLVSMWVQFLGPGIKSAVQEFSGVTGLSDRLEYVERFMPPPPVVEWNESAAKQRGLCTDNRCVYSLVGARTAYGDSCGAPRHIIPFIRSSTGNSTQISFDDDEMTPVVLTRSAHDFLVYLKVPSYLPEGDYSWHAKITYENCPGIGEPIVRTTPWFPLKITKP